MSTREAHKILDAARAGADISVASIMRSLRETGDLDGIRFLGGSVELPSTARQLHATLLANARALLRQHNADHVDDEFALEWAEIILRQNRQAEVAS